jgi:hypothetical protein
MSATSFNKMNYTIDSFIGQTAYGVEISPSEELTALLKEAEMAQDLPFEEKLKVIQNLAINAMQNAWEGMSKGDKNGLSRSMVYDRHSLTDALKHQLGCCRYQATLFFILGAQAKLGSKHFLQSANLGGLNTCYNDVYDENNILHRVSIFALSLSDPANTYVKDTSVFDSPNRSLPGQSFLAYTVDKAGNCTRYCRPHAHLEGDPASSLQAKEEIKKLEGILTQIQTSLESTPSEDDKKKLQQLLTLCTDRIDKQRALIESFASALI